MAIPQRLSGFSGLRMGDYSERECMRAQKVKAKATANNYIVNKLVEVCCIVQCSVIVTVTVTVIVKVTLPFQ